MNVNSSYEQAQQTLELARARKAAAEEAVAKEAKEAEDAQTLVDENRAKAEEQSNRYTAANEKVFSKQAELDGAIARLESLEGSEDEAAIADARREVDRLKQELEQVKREAADEYEKLVRAQQDAQTAIVRAEIEQKEADAAAKELEDAEAELKLAEEELQKAEEAQEAEAAEETQETEEAKLSGTGQLTEEEAIKQGYTIIKTPSQLQAMAENLSGKYILMCDIDLAGFDWKPIGTLVGVDDFRYAFSGVLNGNGFSIKNLTVTAEPGAPGVGLFGVTDGAYITNLNLENIDVSADTEYNATAVGGLIGLSRNTDIDNIYVSGNVTGHQGVGGLIGVESDTNGLHKINISNVTTDVNVVASFYAGGMIGKVNGTEHNSLVITDCSTSGSINITDQAAGGLIGEAGKTVITVNRCSSSMNITKSDEEYIDIFLLDNVSRIGGIIGNCNGTFISVCNSNFTGTLTCDDEFKGDVYGWYMNDSRVTIFELSAGLPADDILNIAGVDDITPIIDPLTGEAHYEITVSTLAGMNRIVDLIQCNPKLGALVTFNIQFDFETMDAQYKATGYNQYGVVQHLYEDASGKVRNDVYIDNEVCLESTFNRGLIECIKVPKDMPDPTMIEGLFKSNGQYYVYTPGTTVGDYEDFTEVSLEFFFSSKANVTKRLNDQQVAIREKLVEVAQGYQYEIQQALLKKYGLNPDFVSSYVIQEPEYKALKKKEASGAALSDEEKFKIEMFELNYKIITIVGEITNNQGCGMGGNASFLPGNEGKANADPVPLEDEWGRTRYMCEDGFEVRQKVDEEGNLVFDEEGNPLYETLEGEDYDGTHGDPFVVMGYPSTDANGNALYTDSEGNTLIKTQDANGEIVYTYEDGTVYEGEPTTVKQQYKEESLFGMMAELEEQMQALAREYGVEL